MAPIPKKELMARLREGRKKNETEWKECLQKDRDRKKKTYVKRNSMSPSELEKQREKTRIKVQKSRLKKKMANVGQPISSPKKSSYKTPQSLGKAVKKVFTALPKSPGKQAVVVKEIVKKTFSRDICKKLFTNRKQILRQNISKELVTKFYCSDEISRQAPGKRDVKSVKNEITGKRQKIPIRHMTMNITDAFYEFKRQNPQSKVGLSTFFSWRPKFVLLSSQTPHNVCVCKKHLNFSFLVEAIRTCTKQFPPSYKDLLNKVCCDKKKENCMFNECSKCKYDVTLLLPPNIDFNLTAKRKKWEEIEGYLQVTEKVCSLEDLLIEINSQLPSFKMHCFIKRIQYEYFEECKNRGDESEAVIQVDFAENASLTAQNQIQSAHWRERHVTVFTCVIWSTSKTESLVIISDDLDHSKYAVWTFLKLIGNFIQEEFPQVDHLIIFSDNAASQFRSKYTVSNLCKLEDDLNCQFVEWTTFAASHGKGAVDGVGAVVKNLLWHKIKAENLNINSAKEYYELATTTCKKTHVFFVPKDDIKQNEDLLNNRWIKARKVQYKVKQRQNRKKKVIGLNSLHYFEKHDDSHVLAGITAKSKLKKIQVLDSDTDTEEEEDYLQESQHQRIKYRDVFLSDNEEETRVETGSSSNQPLNRYEVTARNITCGTYVLVEIKGQIKNHVYNYVAVCQSSVCEEEGEVQVMFMRTCDSSKKLFRTDENDVKFIQFEQIKKILKTPELKISGLNRVQYVFHESIEDVWEA